MLVAILAFLFFSVFGQRKCDEDYVNKLWTYSVETTEVGNDGMIVVNVTDEIRSRTLPYFDMLSRNAIHALLYAGIEGKNGVNSINPLINEDNKIEEPEFFLNDFMRENGPYQLFIGNIAYSSLKVVKMRKPTRYKMTVTLSIKKDELRQYLEDNKIIKKTDNYFKQ